MQAAWRWNKKWNTINHSPGLGIQVNLVYLCFSLQTRIYRVVVDGSMVKRHPIRWLIQRLVLKLLLYRTVILLLLLILFLLVLFLFILHIIDGSDRSWYESSRKDSTNCFSITIVKSFLILTPRFSLTFFFIYRRTVSSVYHLYSEIVDVVVSSKDPSHKLRVKCNSVELDGIRRISASCYAGV